MRFRVTVMALALAAAASSASALTLNSCAAGCMTSGGILFDLDYTVPADGKVYRWDLWTSDPSVTALLYSPNQVDGFNFISNGDGTSHLDLNGFAPPFTFDFAAGPDGHSYYTVSAPAQFDHCGPSSPAGEVCRNVIEVFGNGGSLKLDVGGQPWRPGDPEVKVFFAQSLVPEPQSWALAVLGFGALGVALRRRRAAGLAA